MHAYPLRALMLTRCARAVALAMQGLGWHGGHVPARERPPAGGRRSDGLHGARPARARPERPRRRGGAGGAGGRGHVRVAGRGR
eukprot:105982-Chlamydomonas_euryale.AAC.1